MRIPDNLELLYNYELKNAKGKVVRKCKNRKAHSFVKAFAQLLYGSMATPNSISIKDIGNVDRTVKNYYFNLVAPVSTTTYGTVVGTGITAVTINDYKLETQIAHGTGSGQLQYSAETFGAPTSDATSSEFICTRVFTNASGSTVTVYEIGIYGKIYYNDSSNSTFCIIRDVLASPISISNGGSLTLNYTIKAAV